ncbi:hypothetical protein M8A51_21300 [Schlegelella sp. S2-27]|uniref:Lipoprotein n=1 Tax=Caldimonas mangrovi TaxID=2944811 RepID=A0ABT0YTI9_9BURK|nr:hypothetical protein [Caldimonas mangrovi]MCM5682073.1 hypothetical protein [Caldimonas mangrovi]
MSISKGARWIALGVMSVLVAACGGGGGGSGGSEGSTPTTATGDFSETTYSATADAAATTALSSGSIDSFTGVPLGLSASDRTVDLSSPAGVRAFVLQQAGRHVLEQSLATESQTTDCDVSGTFRVTVTYSDPDEVQAGDKVSFAMNDCVFASGDAPLNGSFTATFRSYTDENDNSMSIVFNDFGSADAMLDGRLTITSSQNGAQLTIAYQDLTATIDDEPVTWYHTIAVGTDLSLGGFIEVDGEAYRLTQVEPFTLSGTGYPSSGTLRITDAQGDRVEIVAGAEGFTYNYYVASNTTGTPTATVQGRLYAD